ncbi:hypothetical protein Tco_1175699 [Tanacetum coccineum]
MEECHLLLTDQIDLMNPEGNRVMHDINKLLPLGGSPGQVLFKFNPGMEHRIWSEDDKRRSQEFIKLIQRRLKIRQIFRSLEIFVSGRLRDVDYRLI